MDLTRRPSTHPVDLYPLYEEKDGKTRGEDTQMDKASIAQYFFSSEKDFSERETLVKSIKGHRRYWKEPMHRVADKILNNESLTFGDLKKWAYYNFDALPKEGREIISAANLKARWSRIRWCFICAPTIGAAYVFGRALKQPLISRGLLGLSALLSVGWICSMYWHYRHSRSEYQRAYDLYKEYVLQPQFRALKRTREMSRFNFAYREASTPALMEIEKLVISKSPANSNRIFKTPPM